MRIQDLESASDENLVASFVRSGDRDALEVLLRRHESSVFGLAYRMLGGSRADALDATQEVFLTVFRKASSFHHQSAFKTWLYRLTVNTCHDFGRKRARTPSPMADGPEPPERPADVETRLSVEAALQQLLPGQRAVVVMRDLYGMSYGEIAASTGVPVGTVKSRIARARLRLGELLTVPEEREL
jgi:RNA polymerase sigma-70 factor (ECF subfamily)